MATFQILLLLTGIVILAAMIWDWRKIDLPLHPTMLLGPMFLHLYVIVPISILGGSGFQKHFETPEALILTAAINLIGMIFFFGGMLFALSRKKDRNRSRCQISQGGREILVILSMVFAAAAFMAYVYQIFNVGGFSVAYARAYGGGGAVSGYVKQLVLFFIPAAGLFLISRDGRKYSLVHMLVIAAMCIPEGIHAILGARRGPLYRVLFAIFLGRPMTSGKRLPAWVFVTIVSIIGVSVIALFAHRTLIYLGSDFAFSGKKVMSRVFVSQSSEGEEYTVNAGTAAMFNKYGRQYWGKRYFVLFFVSAIPKQMWPTQYEDVGMPWLAEAKTYSLRGYSRKQWLDTVGWLPGGGSQIGLCVDMFIEFRWFGFFGCGLVGYLLGMLWRKGMRLGGFWAVANFVAAALYVYIPSQSLDQFNFRFAFAVIPAGVAWLLLVRRQTYRASPSLTRGTPMTGQII